MTKMIWSFRCLAIAFGIATFAGVAPAPETGTSLGVSAAEAQRYRAPRYRAPRYHAPRYRAPRYHAPRVQRSNPVRRGLKTFFRVNRRGR